MKKTLLALLLPLGLSACASYQSLPLQDRPTWSSDLNAIARVTAEPAELAFPALPPHAFAPTADGLDMTDVSILAVLNNPDLRLARDDAHVTHAQAFSASLLPDPQLAMSGDFKRNPDPGSSSGYTIGPSYDFGSLLTHGTLADAADKEAHKADLNLLWQEWQVIAQARLLFIRIVEGQRLQKLLSDQQAFLEQRVAQTQQALARKLITLDVSGAAFTALQDVRRQRFDLDKQQNQFRHDLNNLLGLAPEVQVPLKPQIDLPPLDRTSIDAILPQLPSRRPDLMALRSGYEAQDQRYRAAIIAQFPALNIGLNRARDTSNVPSQGFSVSISLPVFNRNRGNIAIEKATRQKLHDEYQQRLNLAYSDVDRLMQEQALNLRQLQQSEQGVRQLAQQRANVMTAFRAHNLDTLVLMNIETALLAKQTEALALEQAALEQRVALQGVIGGELPLQLQRKSQP
ncbi:TolC family protein [Herbaspirillum lusitanum]|uniref:TolC family protein n=1 Tax=Herbaspirillum lusitanum TaxID=213312 RepID=A0ABW9A838_9BURK